MNPLAKTLLCVVGLAGFFWAMDDFEHVHDKAACAIAKRACVSDGEKMFEGRCAHALEKCASAEKAKHGEEDVGAYYDYYGQADHYDDSDDYKQAKRSGSNEDDGKPEAKAKGNREGKVHKGDYKGKTKGTASGKASGTGEGAYYEHYGQVDDYDDSDDYNQAKPSGSKENDGEPKAKKGKGNGEGKEHKGDYKAKGKASGKGEGLEWKAKGKASGNGQEPRVKGNSKGNGKELEVTEESKDKGKYVESKGTGKETEVTEDIFDLWACGEAKVRCFRDGEKLLDGLCVSVWEMCVKELKEAAIAKNWGKASDAAKYYVYDETGPDGKGKEKGNYEADESKGKSEKEEEDTYVAKKRLSGACGVAKTWCVKADEKILEGLCSSAWERCAWELKAKRVEQNYAKADAYGDAERESDGNDFNEAFKGKSKGKGKDVNGKSNGKVDGDVYNEESNGESNDKGKSKGTDKHLNGKGESKWSEDVPKGLGKSSGKGGGPKGKSKVKGKEPTNGGWLLLGLAKGL